MSAMAWASSTENGLMVAPIYPAWVPRNRIMTAVIESKRRMNISEIITGYNGRTSSLMPKVDPPRLNNVIIMGMTKIPWPCIDVARA